MPSDPNPVTEKRLQELLEPFVTKEFLTTALEPYVTKEFLTKALEPYATKEDLKTALNERTNQILEVLAQFMQQSETQYQDLKTELRSYAGVLIEEAETRFLKTSNDRISICEDRLNNHETRLDKIETVVL